MTLQELLEHALVQQWFTPSYTNPLRTYVKQYGKALGYEVKTCPPAVYHLPDERVTEIIHRAADEDLQPRSVQACVNAILKLLHRAVAEGCLPPFDQPPVRRRTQGFTHPLPYLRQFHPETVPEEIPRGKTTWYGLRQRDWPVALVHECDAYLEWCTPEELQGRAVKIHKVASTQKGVRQLVARIAGYAVSVEGIEKDRLTLRLLCDPTRLEAFAWWWKNERRRYSTKSIPAWLGTMKTIARYWLTNDQGQRGDEACAQAIAQIFGRFEKQAPFKTVQDKDWRMLSLQELDGLAQAYHPLSPARLQGFTNAWFARQLVTVQPFSTMNFTTYAVWFELSFILRLLVHRPLRIGNIAALQFRHLHPQPDGGYEIVIPKAEMKNGKFLGRRAWKERFPTRLLPLLDEWLTIWRPRVQRQDGKFQEYVFLNMHGNPCQTNDLRRGLGMMTIRMTQDRHGGPVAWHPHLIRTTWTREMLNAGLNFTVVRRMMGDSFKIIDKHYGGYEEERPSPFALQLAKEIEQRID